MTSFHVEKKKENVGVQKMRELGNLKPVESVGGCKFTSSTCIRMHACADGSNQQCDCAWNKNIISRKIFGLKKSEFSHQNRPIR